MRFKNLFKATARLNAIDPQLTAIGIDLEATEDVGAAIKAKIDEATAKEREAVKATIEVLTTRVKAFEALEKQAKEAGLDLEAMASEGGVAKVLEEAGREQAREALGILAPPAIEATVGQDALPAGFDLVAKYEELDKEAKGGDPAAVKARADFFQAHAAELLPHLKLAV